MTCGSSSRTCASAPTTSERFPTPSSATPPAMFGTQMPAWLDRAGPFKAVTQPDSALSAKYRLEATVTELYGDFRPGRPATAVMAVQFALVDVDAIGPGLLFERTITRRVPL